MNTPTFPSAADFAQQHLGPDSPQQVRLVCISSIGGASTIEGVSGKLGNEEDSAILAALRDWADAILVTAATAEAERYINIASRDAQARKARGQQPQAQLVLVTKSLTFDVRATDFSVLSPHCNSADWQERKSALEASGHRVFSYSGDIANGIRALQQAGYGRIVCEGGPWLYTELVHHGCVDKLFYTLSPTLLAPITHPLLETASEQGAAIAMELEALNTTADGTVFLRYRNSRRVTHD